MAVHHWETIDVTNSRRPILLPGEALVHVQNNVGLYSGRTKANAHQDGVIYLTSHRICYVDGAQPTLKSIALDLQHIDKVEHNAGFLKSSAKISIRYNSESDSSAGTSGRSTPLPAALIPPKQRPTQDWICSICTFTNKVSSDHIEGAPLPPCVNCGMKPTKNTKISEHVVPPPDPFIKKTIPIRSDKHEIFTPLPVKEQVSHSTSQASFRCPRCTFANHPAIVTCELCGAPLISRNLPPMLQSNSNADERRDTGNAASTISSGQELTSCKLSFRSGGDKDFLDKLRKALVDRAWAKDLTAQLSRMNSNFEQAAVVRGAGISALQSREEQIRSKDANTMTGAFEDLEGLMARAKDMIALAESFANRVAANPALAGSIDAQSLIVESSSALGLSTPIVTKESFGQTAVYHSELARQVAEYLDDGKLRQEGGCITLVDLYAMYNRARNGDVISPEDLMAACQQFDRLKLPVVLRRFRSGIVVVQDRGRNDETTRRLILRWLMARTTGITALDAAEHFGWSVGIAHQELEMTEQAGAIVRDAGIEGLRFYQNTFNEWDWQAWLAGL